MNFDNIEMAAAELRGESWVTPVSMNADPAVRTYLAAATPTRVHELIQIVKRQKVAHDNLVLEVAAEKQRADMLLDQAQHAAAAVQAEQKRYELLAQELAAAKAAIPAQTGMPGIRQLAAQLDSDEKWTVAEQKAFAPFLAQFPNERSQGIISLGSAWKHGVAYGVSLQPVQQPAPVARQENPQAATYPEEIWLNPGEVSADECIAYTDGLELTWCWEKIDSMDVRYVRADLAEESKRRAEKLAADWGISQIEIAELRQKLNAAPVAAPVDEKKV